MSETFTLEAVHALVPFITFLLVQVLVWLLGRIPKALMAPVVVPATGLLAAAILEFANGPETPAILAALLGAAAVALQKAVEHFGGLAKAVGKRLSFAPDVDRRGLRWVPMTESARARKAREAEEGGFG